jgi:hypothetical protein
MPRYRLRTLLIVLALGPLVLAGAWYVMTGGRFAMVVRSIVTLAALWTVIAYWPQIRGKGG